MAENLPEPTGKSGEQARTSSSYIMTFYYNVQDLTHYKSTYKNIILELKNLYPDMESNIENSKKMNDEEHTFLIQHAQTLRYYCDVVYTSYQAVCLDLQLPSNEEVKDAFNKIMNSYIPSAELIDTFTIQMHHFLLQEIIQGMLRGGQQLIETTFKQ